MQPEKKSFRWNIFAALYLIENIIFFNLVI